VRFGLELEKGNDRTRTAIDRLSLLSHYDASRIPYSHPVGGALDATTLPTKIRGRQ
jgi:hypothetical protein